MRSARCRKFLLKKAKSGIIPLFGKSRRNFLTLELRTPRLAKRKGLKVGKKEFYKTSTSRVFNQRRSVAVGLRLVMIDDL